jgi:hypothetical protein
MTRSNVMIFMRAPISLEQYFYFLFGSFSTLLAEATSALTRQSDVWFKISKLRYEISTEVVQNRTPICVRKKEVKG